MVTLAEAQEMTELEIDSVIARAHKAGLTYHQIYAALIEKSQTVNCQADVESHMKEK